MLDSMKNIKQHTPAIFLIFIFIWGAYLWQVVAPLTGDSKAGVLLPSSIVTVDYNLISYRMHFLPDKPQIGEEIVFTVEKCINGKCTDCPCEISEKLTGESPALSVAIQKSTNSFSYVGKDVLFTVRDKEEDKTVEFLVPNDGIVSAIIFQLQREPIFQVLTIISTLSGLAWVITLIKNSKANNKKAKVGKTNKGK